MRMGRVRGWPAVPARPTALTPRSADSPAAAALAALSPRTDTEAEHVRLLSALVATTHDPFDRTIELHLTGSALVVHPATRRVLLRWHVRQQAWIQVGGHADPGERDPLAVALREAAEETGLTDLRVLGDAVAVHAVIVPVPARGDELAHRHGDLRYVLATDEPQRAVAEDDAAPLRWCSLTDALALTSEENVRDTLWRVGAQLA